MKSKIVLMMKKRRIIYICVCVCVWKNTTQKTLLNLSPFTIFFFFFFFFVCACACVLFFLLLSSTSSLLRNHQIFEQEWQQHKKCSLLELSTLNTKMTIIKCWNLQMDSTFSHSTLHNNTMIWTLNVNSAGFPFTFIYTVDSCGKRQIQTR